MKVQVKSKVHHKITHANTKLERQMTFMHSTGKLFNFM